MTVNTNLSRVQYNGNGVTTAFAFANRVTDATQLLVTRTVIATGADTTLILNSLGADGFSVSGVPGSSVTVNTITAPATGTRLTISYNMPFTQTADYVPNDPFPAETHEGALDKLTIICQQQQDGISRALKFPLTSSTALTPVLPNAPVDQACLIWSGTTGQLANGPTTTDIANAATNAATATAAAAQAVAAATNAPVYNCPTVGGTANAITLTTSATVTSLSNGQIFEFTPTANQTGACTAFINGIGSAQPILDMTGSALTTGAILNGVPTLIMRYGSNFYLLSDGRTMLTSAAQTVTGAKTFNAGTLLAADINGGQIAGMRNKIINGAMVIDQRTVGSGVTVNAAAQFYGLDRWRGYGTGAAGVFTMVRASATPPAGFSHYMRCTVTTADASPAAGSLYNIGQGIEGFNCADLGFGTANASPVTVSFQVRSSLTGTFSGVISNAAASRTYPFTFTINAANTWEPKSVTIPGDTTGAWNVDASAGMYLFLDLGNGSNSRSTAGSWQAAALGGVTGAVRLISTNGATFDLTGSQIEKGSVATAFEWRQFQTELALCQRYWQKTFPYASPAVDNGGVNGAHTFAQMVGASTAITGTGYPYKVTMRTAPTVTIKNPSGGTAGQYYNANTATSCTGSTTGSIGDSNLTFGCTTPAATAAGQMIAGHLIMDAEY